MKTMIVSDFKSKCIEVIKRVHGSREPIVVTWRGQPLVRVEPFGTQAPQRKLGAQKGKIRINADIVNFEWSSEWEATQ